MVLSSDFALRLPVGNGLRVRPEGRVGQPCQRPGFQRASKTWGQAPLWGPAAEACMPAVVVRCTGKGMKCRGLAHAILWLARVEGSAPGGFEGPVELCQRLWAAGCSPSTAMRRDGEALGLCAADPLMCAAAGDFLLELGAVFPVQWSIRTAC